MACDHDHLPVNALTENVILDEMYYKDMLAKAKINFLPHKDYSHLLRSVNFVEMKNDIMQFFVKNNYNGWHTYVKFDEWNNEVADLEYTPVEASRLLLWGANIRVQCDCPAFAFWGYQYILTQTDSAIIPETRFPHIRNPHLKGAVCKHLKKTLTTMGFHLGDMAREIKLQRAAMSANL